MAVGAVMRHADRYTRCLAEKRTFRPLFALSVGFGPVASPPSGAFPVDPSHESQPQSIPIMAPGIEGPIGLWPKDVTADGLSSMNQRGDLVFRFECGV